MGEGGRGVFQVAPKGQVGSLFLPEGASAREARLAEHRLLEKVAEVSGRPVTYGLIEVATDPEDAGLMVAESDRAIARGLGVYPQISPRGAGLMYMLEGYHIFQMKPSYREIAHLPLQARVEAMRDPARRAAILRELDVEGEFANDKMALTLLHYIISQNANSYILNSPVDFEPGPEQRLDALAAVAGKTPQEYLYDHYTSGRGTNFNLNLVANYVYGNLDTTLGFLMNPNVISGLTDGGAHSRIICDAAMPTFQLAYWTRQRTRGERVPLPFMINKLTAAPAQLYDLKDRGILEVGMRADINVIDYERLTLKAPRMAYDLPSGSGRILQDSQGYLATFVAGVATRRNDKDTGARPGRLLRSTGLA
jgi:N-acyl-D-aspartate/D-glutamate deacylase